jgi:hypothetical protein
MVFGPLPSRAELQWAKPLERRLAFRWANLLILRTLRKSAEGITDLMKKGLRPAYITASDKMSDQIVKESLT